MQQIQKGAIMNEKPILFSGEMVRAILDGRKTQTRRVVKPQPGDGFEWKGWLADTSGNRANIGKACWENRESLETLMIRSPYGKPGDLLWVRETHWLDWYEDGVVVDGQPAHVHYRAGHPHPVIAKSIDGHWRPSIFMPRWASRITLRVTDVRVERVQEIHYSDVVAEGVTDEFYNWSGKWVELWDRINAKRGYGWDINPWVWVVEFEVVQS
jgi:hypothetical protein